MSEHTTGHDLTDKEKETLRRAALVRRRLYEHNMLSGWHEPEIEALAAMYHPSMEQDEWPLLNTPAKKS